MHTASWRTAYAGILPADYLAGQVEADHANSWRALLADRVTAGMFVAEADARVVGFAYLRPVGARILLDNLHAHPGARGQGIGSRLVEAGLGWAGESFPDREVYLEVLTANTAAIGFYESRGWQRTASGTVRFPDGTTVAEFEYTWRGVAPRTLIAAPDTNVTDPELR
ncbi:GNAT family N-acetyltransferase [Nocardia lasii]|uniref:GNAT family N-acetyltransferase n=1 Tax=Nocardia lasii TaxID=1616107 RepID=A0ABW1JZS7_9NOCA